METVTYLLYSLYLAVAFIHLFVSDQWSILYTVQVRLEHKRTFKKSKKTIKNNI